MKRGDNCSCSLHGGVDGKRRRRTISIELRATPLPKINQRENAQTREINIGDWVASGRVGVESVLKRAGSYRFASSERPATAPFTLQQSSKSHKADNNGHRGRIVQQEDCYIARD